MAEYDIPDELEVRGEVFITNKDFANLNIRQKRENQKIFANPRNAASGSLRQKNPNETKKIPLRFIAYTFGYVDKFHIMNELFVENVQKEHTTFLILNEISIDNLIPLLRLY